MNGPIDDYPFSKRIPDGDNRERDVCGQCGWIHYRNPQVVVGAVCTWEGRLLLCRRAIQPRHGYWTIPAGYLEENETTEAGACRETMEEAGATIRIEGLLAIYNIPRISQVQLIYRASMVDGRFESGEESLETCLVDPADIPWGELAFPTVRWALEQFATVDGEESHPPFTNPPGDLGEM